MYSKKDIAITDKDGDYQISVDLSNNSVLSVFTKSHAGDEWSITSLGQLPDKVQIHFYKKFKQLQNDYKSTSQK